MIKQRLAELGYTYEPANLKIATFHAATRVGNLIFTSGQVSRLDKLEIRGKVGADVDLPTAQKAAKFAPTTAYAPLAPSRTSTQSPESSKCWAWSM